MASMEVFKSRTEKCTAEPGPWQGWEPHNPHSYTVTHVGSWEQTKDHRYPRDPTVVTVVCSSSGL